MTQCHRFFVYISEREFVREINSERERKEIKAALNETFFEREREYV
jgi:hypothetical protein